MSIVRHSMWAASAAISSMATRFCLTAVLARHLPTGIFGQFTFCQWLVDITFLVCSMGATGVASRFFAEYGQDEKRLNAVVRYWRPFSLLLPCVAGMVVVLGAYLSALPFSKPEMLWLFGWAVANGIWAMNTAALAGLQRFDRIFLSNLIGGAIMLLGTLAISREVDGLNIVFMIMAAAAAAASCAGAFDVRRAAGSTRSGLSAFDRRLIMTYAVNVWITALLWNLVWSRGEFPVIRWLLNDEAVAVYSVATTLYAGAVSAVMLGIGGISPQIASFVGQGRFDEANRLCRQAMDIQLLVCGAGALVIIWLAPELIHYLFGARYFEGAKILAVLAVGLPGLTVACHSYLLQIDTGARYNRNTSLLGVIVLMSFATVGIYTSGLVAAAWSRAGTSLLLMLVTCAVVTHKWGKSAISWRNLLYTVAIISASELLSGYFHSQLLLRIAAALCSALGVMFLLKDDQERVISTRIALKLFRSGRLMV